MKSRIEDLVSELANELDRRLVDETESELEYAEACEIIAFHFKTAANAARENAE